MPSIRAVLFDYGKVLSLPPTEAQWQALSSRFGLAVQAFQRLYWGHREGLDRGTLTNVSYWKQVGADCGHTVSDEEAEQLIDHDCAQWTNVNEPMLELSRQLREAGYRTAILSNMEPRMLAFMRRKLTWLDEFPVQIYSCQVGTVKPEAAIYLLCCSRLGCLPEEALFLDDKQVNTGAAKALGMAAYVYHSAPDAVMLTGQPEITVAGLREQLLKPASSLPPSAK
jgi:putative hydrolase of the HAD superfamily